MVGHRLTSQSFLRYPPRRLAIVVPTWCGYGVLWLVVAEPTIRFRISGHGAAFGGAKSTPPLFRLPCGRAG